MAIADGAAPASVPFLAQLRTAVKVRCLRPVQHLFVAGGCVAPAGSGLVAGGRVPAGGRLGGDLGSGVVSEEVAAGSSPGEGQFVDGLAEPVDSEGGLVDAAQAGAGDDVGVQADPGGQFPMADDADEVLLFGERAFAGRN